MIAASEWAVAFWLTTSPSASAGSNRILLLEVGSVIYPTNAYIMCRITNFFRRTENHLRLPQSLVPIFEHVLGCAAAASGLGKVEVEVDRVAVFEWRWVPRILVGRAFGQVVRRSPSVPS